jgi:hypothetical protein
MTAVSARAVEMLEMGRARVYNPGDFKPGAFGLSVGGGVGGTAVRAGHRLLARDNGPFTHAWMILDNDEVIEAEPGGARIRSIAAYLDHQEILICDTPVQDRLDRVHQESRGIGVHCSLTDADAFYGWVENIIRGDLVWTARQLRGTPYGWLQYPYIGLAAHGHRWRLLKSLIGNKRVVGSQLVDLIYLNNGMRLFDDGRWPGQVTPGDLHAYARGATR